MSTAPSRPFSCRNTRMTERLISRSWIAANMSREGRTSPGIAHKSRAHGMVQAVFPFFFRPELGRKRQLRQPGPYGLKHLIGRRHHDLSYALRMASEKKAFRRAHAMFPAFRQDFGRSRHPRVIRPLRICSSVFTAALYVSMTVSGMSLSRRRSYSLKRAMVRTTSRSSVGTVASGSS